MPSPDVLDIAKLLAPISKEKPTGEDLRGDSSPNSLYYLIKDARNAARSAERQLVLGDEEAAKPPDWRPVLEQGKKALAEKAKDLEIAAYVIEALVRVQGFAGLRDGFRLARGLVDQFWDGLYPMPDEEGLATRVAPLTALNGEDTDGTLIVPLAKVPITETSSGGRLAYAHYHEASNLNKIADLKLREKKLAGGAVSLEMFQKAVAETPSKFFSNLVEDLKQCSEEFARLCDALGKRCGASAPPSSNIRTALTTNLDLIKDVARHKLVEPAPPPPGDKQGGGKGTDGPPAGGAAGDGLRTREDAFRDLMKVAEFFRRTEPHSVVSYALEQVVRWGRLSLPELLVELIPDEGPRKSVFKQVGIKPPEPPPKEAPKK